VRHATSMSAVLSGSAYGSAYDLVIAHTDHGEQMKSIDSLRDLKLEGKHLMVVLGDPSVKGSRIENVIAADADLQLPSGQEFSIFDHCVNLCPTGGMLSVFPEEVVMVGLSNLRNIL